MLTVTNASVTREHVWTAFRRSADVRQRERYHAILLLMDGKSCPEVAPWLYRDEETIRTWVHALNAQEQITPGADPVTSCCHAARLQDWFGSFLVVLP